MIEGHYELGDYTPEVGREEDTNSQGIDAHGSLGFHGSKIEVHGAECREVAAEIVKLLNEREKMAALVHEVREYVKGEDALVAEIGDLFRELGEPLASAKMRAALKGLDS